MAWNKYYIFIQSPRLTNLDSILAKLNLGQFKPIREVPLNYSNKSGTLFAGFYHGNLIIVHPELPFYFFGDTQSDIEKLFIDTFPGCEIAALVENRTVALFSYAVIVKGKKIRVKDGADGMYFNDRGDLLPEEIEILSQKMFEEEEINEMKGNGLSAEEIAALINFEACWRVPNLISKRYLGEKLDSLDPEKIILTEYSDGNAVNDDEYQNNVANHERLRKYFEDLSKNATGE